MKLTCKVCGEKFKAVKKRATCNASCTAKLAWKTKHRKMKRSKSRKVRKVDTSEKKHMEKLWNDILSRTFTDKSVFGNGLLSKLKALKFNNNGTIVVNKNYKYVEKHFGSLLVLLVRDAKKSLEELKQENWNEKERWNGL